MTDIFTARKIDLTAQRTASSYYILNIIAIINRYGEVHRLLYYELRKIHNEL